MGMEGRAGAVGVTRGAVEGVAKCNAGSVGAAMRADGACGAAFSMTRGRAGAFCGAAKFGATVTSREKGSRRPGAVLAGTGAVRDFFGSGLASEFFHGNITMGAI